MSSPLPITPQASERPKLIPSRVWEMPWSTDRRRERRNVLIVGGGKSSRKLAAYLSDHPLASYAVRGFLDDGAPADSEVLGTVEDLSRIALAEFVDEIIVAGPCERDLVRRVVGEAQRMRLDVRVIPDLFGLDPKLVALERLGDLPILRLHREPVPRLALFLKRVLDLVLSAIGMALAAPLLPAIALAVVCGSGRPVFYEAWRVGRKGKRFLCYKFRTMVPGADDDKDRLRTQNERRGPVFKMANDPRVTGVGRWLRRYSLDELPQFWNVLCGEMSLVGPRPHPIDDCANYDPEHLRRLEVKPGMTGLWQVTARNDPSFQRNMALDLEYIEHWSLWLDLRILWKTLAAVVTGSGT